MYTVPPSVFWSSFQSTSLRINVKYLTFTIHSVNSTTPIQTIILTNESTSKSPNSCINSLLYHFLQFALTLIPPYILLKTFFFFSRVASRLAISLFSVQNSAPYIVIGLINVLWIFIFSALSADWLFSRGRSA